RVVHAIETLEYPLAVHRGNARPRVLYFDHRLARRCRRRRQADHALVGCVFDGVVQKVRDAMSEDARVAHRRHRYPNVNGAYLILLLGQHTQAVRDTDDELRQVDDGSCRWNSPGLGPREEQEILDEPREPIDLLEHTCDDVAVLLNGE